MWQCAKRTAQLAPQCLTSLLRQLSFHATPTSARARSRRGLVTGAPRLTTLRTIEMWQCQATVCIMQSKQCLVWQPTPHGRVLPMRVKLNPALVPASHRTTQTRTVSRLRHVWLSLTEVPARPEAGHMANPQMCGSTHPKPTCNTNCQAVWHVSVINTNCPTAQPLGMCLSSTPTVQLPSRLACVCQHRCKYAKRHRVSQFNIILY